MQIPIGSSHSGQLSGSQSMNFAGFTYNKDASSFVVPQPVERVGGAEDSSPTSPSAQKNRSNDSNYTQASNNTATAENEASVVNKQIK